MLRALTWTSAETSPVLTPKEVDMLFEFTWQLAQTGQLSDGKHAGANRVLFWQRLKGN